MGRSPAAQGCGLRPGGAHSSPAVWRWACRLPSLSLRFLLGPMWVSLTAPGLLDETHVLVLSL